MDRTTLGRNALPLERQGLIAIEKTRTDRRSKELRLTDAGLARLRKALERWSEAQARFETLFGGERSAGLRDLLHRVSATNLAESASPRPQPVP